MRAVRRSRYSLAPGYLGGLSFAGSSFFPIPPSVMLAPMTPINPSRAWHFALIITLIPVAGALFGYAIGYFAFETLEPWLRASQYWDSDRAAVDGFARGDFWAVFVVGVIVYHGSNRS